MHPYVNASYLDFCPGSRIIFKLLPLTERLPLTVNTFKQTICFTHTHGALCKTFSLRMTHKIACLVQFKETLKWIDVLFSVNIPKKKTAQAYFDRIVSYLQKKKNFSVNTSQYFPFKLAESSF